MQNQATIDSEENIFPDYPIYPPGDDIYSKAREEDLNPEDMSEVNKPDEKPGKLEILKQTLIVN